MMDVRYINTNKGTKLLLIFSQKVQSRIIKVLIFYKKQGLFNIFLLFYKKKLTLKYELLINEMVRVRII